MLYKECLDCGEHFDDMGIYDINKCPECNSKKYTEVYDIECNECGCEFEDIDGDECPECGNYDTEEPE